MHAILPSPSSPSPSPSPSPHQFFTALPPLALGIGDQDIAAHLRLSLPASYKKTQSGKYFNIWVSSGCGVI